LYPSKAMHKKAWEQLANNIAATADEISDQITDQKNKPEGSLTVIGSGIETVGFMMGDENLIRNADHVFYCVADPATVVWIKDLRPDAYDLYVLYDDHKVRYTTYMQMTEALLYYVRKGKRVVGIYYGHPGIFVLSTHRAIEIARREGYKAMMRSNVSALDCLCSDLGIDPCHPGMQTHEATDMLIRMRRPDTQLHVVLWQVGLIGEMGYRRKGYINDNFSVFIEYLQQFYGADYPVTHYVASKYPTIPPIIEIYPLSQLHNPEIQMKVTGISTFYLPPKDIAEANKEMVERLGLIKPGQRLRKPEGPLRIIDRYTSREMKAFSQFTNFTVPKDYQWQEDTAASRFIIALREDVRLQERFEADPHAALDQFADLSPRERALLATKDPGAMQIAAKGTLNKTKENQMFLYKLLNRKRVAIDLNLCVDGWKPEEQLHERLAEWAAKQDYQVDWSSLSEDVNIFMRSKLFPWTGVYLADSEEWLITIIGSLKDNSRSYLYINDQRIRNFHFAKGVLKWSATGMNPNAGFLRVDTLSNGTRRLIGKIWAKETNVPMHNLMANEVRPGYFHLSQMIGQYEKGEDLLEIKVDRSPGGQSQMNVLHNGRLLSPPYTLDRRNLQIGANTFQLGTMQMLKMVDSDAYWWPINREDYRSFIGAYVVRLNKRLLRQFELHADHLMINGHRIEHLEFDNGQLRWQNGPENFAEGALSFLLDPILLSPVLFGQIYTSGRNLCKKCHGAMPVVSTDKMRWEHPEFALPDFAWQHLLKICQKASEKGGLLLWHKWEKYRYTHLVTHRTLKKLNV
ncbi:MAG: SAM-dependent methyltransferase, partial [Bacteroidota bacterium]